MAAARPSTAAVPQPARAWDRPEGAALYRRLARTTTVTITAANALGAVLVTVYSLWLFPAGDLPPNLRTGEAVVLIGIYLGVTLALGAWLAGRISGPAQRAVLQGRVLDEQQRRSLLAAPWLTAVMSFGFWAMAGLLAGAYDYLRFDDQLNDALGLTLLILLGGLTTAAIAFLLNERPLRPLYALAFRGGPPARAKGPAVGWRLLLAWIVGAGVPLMAIALTFYSVGRPAYVDVRTAVLTLVAVALAAGWMITSRVARSVAEPLEGLRDALDRVGEGDLETEVPVDDATEIGLLQAGFNEMVAGLRERERLEDLFGRHVGPEVAREALSRGVGLGGELREVSALFVDVVGSTRLAATRPPQEVVEILNAVFGAVVRTAEAEGGWVNKFEGDAALCVFGAPIEQPDHAGQALRAARALRDELKALARRHPGLDAGIGVSSGQAVAGNVGAEQRYEYTVIGDPVNEAARLTEQAKGLPGRVLASGDSIARAGEEAAHWNGAGALELRGRPEATAAYVPAA